MRVMLWSQSAVSSGSLEEFRGTKQRTARFHYEPERSYEQLAKRLHWYRRAGLLSGGAFHAGPVHGAYSLAQRFQTGEPVHTDA